MKLYCTVQLEDETVVQCALNDAPGVHCIQYRSTLFYVVALASIHCTLFSTVYSVNYTVYSVQCTLFSTLCDVQC